MELNAGSYTYKSRLFNYMVILTGIVLSAVSVSMVNVSGWKETTIFIVMYFVSQLLPTRLPHGDVLSVTIFLDMALIVLFGTPFAITVGFAATIITRFFSAMFGHRGSVFNTLKLAAQSALVIGLTGFAYNLVSNRIIAFVVSSLVYFAVSVFFLFAYSRLISNDTLKIGWVSVVRMLYLNYAVLAMMAFTMTLIYSKTPSEWRAFSILLFFVPILLVSHSFRLYSDIRQSYLNTVKTVAAAIEANDSYTNGHSERVAELTLALGKESGLPERELQKLQYVALLHDVGKIGVSEAILNKPGSLTEAEYEEIKRHSAIGAEILQKIKFLSGKSEIILYHHEKYDGSGYPEGLKGEEIPLESRILTICDAYDAIITDRPYRRARSPQEAVTELVNMSSVQFDPELVRTFKAVLKKMGEI